MPSTVRAGLIGPGFVAYTHARALERITDLDVEIVAVAAVPLGQADEFARRHGIDHAYDDCRRVMERNGINLVTLAVPNHLHERFTLETADQDVHAGELATSLMLHLAPETIRGDGADHLPEVGKEYLNYVAFGALCPGGVWGRPSLATSEKGARALGAAVQRTIAYIEETLAHLATMKARIPPKEEAHGREEST